MAEPSEAEMGRVETNSFPGRFRCQNFRRFLLALVSQVSWIQCNFKFSQLSIEQRNLPPTDGLVKIFSLSIKS